MVRFKRNESPEKVRAALDELVELMDRVHDLLSEVDYAAEWDEAFEAAGLKAWRAANEIEYQVEYMMDVGSLGEDAASLLEQGEPNVH